MNIKQIIETIETIGNPQFVGVTYTAKKSGETARYTLLIGASYTTFIAKRETELQIRLQSATGIEHAVIAGMLASITTGREANAVGMEHPSYTKAGLYRPICRGIKIALNDLSLELCGEVISRTVITPGIHKAVAHRSEETACKARIEKTLPKFVTLAIDAGNIHGVRANGATLEFD